MMEKYLVTSYGNEENNFSVIKLVETLPFEFICLINLCQWHNYKNNVNDTPGYINSELCNPLMYFMTYVDHRTLYLLKQNC